MGGPYRIAATAGTVFGQNCKHILAHYAKIALELN